MSVEIAWEIWQVGCFRFIAIFETSFLTTMEHFLDLLPFVVNTTGQKVPFSTSSTLVLYILSFSSSACTKALATLCFSWDFACMLITFTSKKVFWSSRLNPFILMSDLDLSHGLTLCCKTWLSVSWRCGSISVSLYAMATFCCRKFLMTSCRRVI